jgi:hypothetical protein
MAFGAAARVHSRNPGNPGKRLIFRARDSACARRKECHEIRGNFRFLARHPLNEALGVLTVEADRVCKCAVVERDPMARAALLD